LVLTIRPGQIVSAAKPFCIFIVFILGGTMIKDEAYYNSLTEQIIGCAYTVGNSLGCGFLEKVYENALAIELTASGLNVETQKPISVYYTGKVVGEYFADMIVDDEIIVELKAVKTIENIHFAQCQNYLKATGKKLGLIINFGEEKVKVRRVANGI
jgi:GxxExxY protein